MHNPPSESRTYQQPIPPLIEVRPDIDNIDLYTYQTSKSERLDPEELKLAGGYIIRLLNYCPSVSHFASDYSLPLESVQQHTRRSKFLSKEMVSLSFSVPTGNILDVTKTVNLHIDKSGWLRSRGRYFTRFFNRKRGYVLEGPEPQSDTEPVFSASVSF